MCSSDSPRIAGIPEFVDGPDPGRSLGASMVRPCCQHRYTHSVAVSKEDVIAAIRREAAVNNGEPLGQSKFEEATGIKPHVWKGRYWARWNDAVAEAGYMGRAWGNRSPHRELSATDAAEILAELVRDYGYYPTGPDLSLRRRTESSIPHLSVFSARLGNIDARRAAVYRWALEHDGWEDVAEIVRPLVKSAASTTAEPIVAAAATSGYVYLFKSGDYHKIGHSSHVGRREYEVGLELPERVDTVHVIETDDPEGIESYWHRRFANRRANGEWFKLSTEDVAVFRRRKYM